LGRKNSHQARPDSAQARPATLSPQEDQGRENPERSPIGRTGMSAQEQYSARAAFSSSRISRTSFLGDSTTACRP